jgi:hypothetical protein
MTDGMHRIAENRSREPGFKCRQGWHSVIPLGQILAAGQKIQLINKRSVEFGCGQMQHHFDRRQVGDNRRTTPPTMVV